MYAPPPPFPNLVYGMQSPPQSEFCIVDLVILIFLFEITFAFGSPVPRPILKFAYWVALLKKSYRMTKKFPKFQPHHTNDEDRRWIRIKIRPRPPTHTTITTTTTHNSIDVVLSINPNSFGRGPSGPLYIHAKELEVWTQPPSQTLFSHPPPHHNDPQLIIPQKNISKECVGLEHRGCRVVWIEICSHHNRWMIRHRKGIVLCFNTLHAMQVKKTCKERGNFIFLSLR